uniref:uncharacterized protein LOC103793958 n=1 Tax=Callithrix jacchus TaxID=9483 RepID=UPI0004F0897D|nr:uncharacterized protein LOC103793958 [Callithrix jacchus]
MLFGAILWLDDSFLPWLPRCLESRDLLGPQRPARSSVRHCLQGLNQGLSGNKEVPVGPVPVSTPRTSPGAQDAPRRPWAAGHQLRVSGDRGCRGVPETRPSLSESGGGGSEKRQCGCGDPQLPDSAHGDRDLPGAAAATLRSALAGTALLPRETTASGRTRRAPRSCSRPGGAGTVGLPPVPRRPSRGRGHLSLVPRWQRSRWPGNRSPTLCISPDGGKYPDS